MQDAEGLLDARALVAADTGGELGRLALTQVVRCGEQRQQEPVAQFQRVGAHRIDHAVQPRPEDFQDVNFVVVRVEVAAPAAVAERQAAERHQDGIFGALDGFGRRQTARWRQALAAMLEQGKNIRPPLAHERTRGARVGHPVFD